MLFTWLKNRRRRQLLATAFPAAWLKYLERNVPHYAYLSEAEQTKLRDDLRIFIAEKHWEGCGGLVLTDEIRVTIAAQAGLLVLAMPHEFFPQVPTILVYPRGFRASYRRQRGNFLEEQGYIAELGQANYRGPVILSWADVLAGGRDAHDGQNLVFHEFAHQLDALNGMLDGTPALDGAAQYRRWRQIMTREFHRLRFDVDQGYPTLLDPYGTTNEAEFFAVATECFFERPVELADQHPELYELLRDYYRQDPAQRVMAKKAS
jgi:Mlc titration factor MtfA (ptsG expression regulator)